MLDAHALRILLAVADEGAVTGAARSLGYTPSNVTQHLRSLERSLGRRLVERQGRGIRLTADGRSVARLARPIVDGLTALPSSLAEVGVGGSVSVAAVPTAVRGLLIPAMADLSVLAPEVEVIPRELDAAQALADLRSGRVDVVLTKYWAGVRRPELPARLRQEPLLTDRIDVLLPPSHPLSSAPQVTVEDLAGDVWAIVPPDDPFRDWLESTLPFSSRGPRRLEATEVPTLVGYVAQGLAVTALPRLGRGTVPEGVVVRPLADPRARRTINLVTHGGPRGAAVEAVVEALGRVVAAVQPSLLADDPP